MWRSKQAAVENNHKPARTNQSIRGKGETPKKEIMRSEKQIAAEIKALEACKSYIPAETVFGDNNIEYLRGEIDTTADEFFSGFSDDEQSAILEAKDWKEGQLEESPSSGWDNYKPTKKDKPTRGTG